MEADRHERAREVMRTTVMGDGWLATFDPDLPEWMATYQREVVAAYERGDLDWLLERTHPEVEIVQPLDLPDARSYHGHEGLIDALLDWPNEWENFRVEPVRVFSPGDDRLIIQAIHRGRSLKMGFEVEIEVFWLFVYEHRLTRRWDMFLTLEGTLEAARV